MKIAIMATYFGNLPAFAQLFLASCDKNRTIDFLLIGDAWRSVEEDVPENCYVQGIDLDEFKVLSEKYTGIKPFFASAYKLCDYKPVLADIFQKALAGYDYWGFCDVDIILGDTRFFLKDLCNYDVFSTNNDYFSGPLFLIRNCDLGNSLYKRSKDVKRILSTDTYYNFDECAFVWSELQVGKSILDVETSVESMTEVIVKAAEAGEINAYFNKLSLEPKRRFCGTVEVKGGQVLMGDNSYIHYHHLHNKGSAVYTYPKWHWRQVPDEYDITKYGVFRRSRPLEDLGYRMVQFYDQWRKRANRKFANRAAKQQDPNETKIT